MNLKYPVFFVLVLSLMGCTEEFRPSIGNVDKNLVVESTITNEMKKQRIKLTRTFDFKADTTSIERNANVQVVDDQNKVYNFAFSQKDKAYISTEVFQAMPGRSYQLKIETQDGHKYSTEPQPLPGESQVEIKAKAGSVNNAYGLLIEASSNDPNNESKFYRYKYEETYKITLPKWGPYKGVVLGPKTVTYKLREDQSKVCYNTVKSNEFLLTNTTDLSEDQVTDFLVAFRNANDYALAEKYSILVKQYVENPEAYFYFKTTDKISSANGNQFSPQQPGYVESNIKAENHPDEKVVGFFAVASVSEQRIFAEYRDFFPEKDYPSYFNECVSDTLNSLDTIPAPGHKPEVEILIADIKTDSRILYRVDQGFIYVMVPLECSSCKAFTSNTKPDFWE